MKLPFSEFIKYKDEQEQFRVEEALYTLYKAEKLRKEKEEEEKREAFYRSKRLQYQEDWYCEKKQTKKAKARAKTREVWEKWEEDNDIYDMLEKQEHGEY